MSFDVVIGLEIHVQLNTKSKLFSSSPTAFGASPNSQANLVDLAMPGALPVLNQEAVKKAAIFGFAVDATVARTSIFDRKNYFYPDSPKGYQISQFYHPIVQDGFVMIDLDDGSQKRIDIERAHIEEDAGKSLHEDFEGMSGIDLNRAGTPLIEVVTAPVMYSAKEAVAYMKKIHGLVRYLNISDANMQEGSFRCDANVSVKPKGSDTLGTRTEIKNLNSFRFIEQAINYEVERQIDVIESGQSVIQETRLYDPDKNETRTMRNKEEANDYRYFPDPDLAPVVLDDDFLNAIRNVMPPSQDMRIKQYKEEYGMNKDDIALLVETNEMANYFEAAVELCKHPKAVANRMIADVLPQLKTENRTILESLVSSQQLAQLVEKVEEGVISNSAGKTVFKALWDNDNGGDIDAIIEAKNLKQMSDTGALEKIVDEILANNTEQFESLKQGNGKIMGFFVGQIMKATQGKANPKMVNQLINQKMR